MTTWDAEEAPLVTGEASIINAPPNPAPGGPATYDDQQGATPMSVNPYVDIVLEDDTI